MVISYLLLGKDNQSFKICHFEFIQIYDLKKDKNVVVKFQFMNYNNSAT